MEKEILVKQLLYRSNHRGCKETDILLGKFFNENFKKFDEKKLKLYDQFICEDDMLIYDWIMEKIPENPKYLNLILEIRQFHNI